MSVDKFYFVPTGGIARQIGVDEELPPQNHTVYVSVKGVEYLYFFEDAAAARVTFEHLRRQPCENIELMVDGDRIAGGRLQIDPSVTAQCKKEVRDLGQALFAEHGLVGWDFIFVSEDDDTGDQDDIGGSFGRCLWDDKRIWVNERYIAHPLIGQLILHELAHALTPEDREHGAVFNAKLVALGGQPYLREDTMDLFEVTPASAY